VTNHSERRVIRPILACQAGFFLLIHAHDQIGLGQLARDQQAAKRSADPLSPHDVAQHALKPPVAALVANARHVLKAVAPRQIHVADDRERTVGIGQHGPRQIRDERGLALSGQRGQHAVQVVAELAFLFEPIQPVMIGGHVEITGSAGNRIALLYGSHEFILTAGLPGLTACVTQCLQVLDDIAEYLAQPFLVYPGIRLQGAQRAGVALQFLYQLGLYVGSAQHFHDIEQGGQAQTAVPLAGPGHIVTGQIKQVFHAQERADTFIERLFECDCGFHRRIAERSVSGFCIS